MRKYEDLSKHEKDKLSIYLQYTNILNISFVMLILFGLFIFLVGWIMLFIFTILIVNLAGTVFLVIGMLLIFVCMFSFVIDKKYLFLIFGYKNLYSDIFGITKEDIKKVKIIREVKWIKEGEKE